MTTNGNFVWKVEVSFGKASTSLKSLATPLNLEQRDMS